MIRRTFKSNSKIQKQPSMYTKTNRVCPNLKIKLFALEPISEATNLGQFKILAVYQYISLSAGNSFVFVFKKFCITVFGDVNSV